MSLFKKKAKAKAVEEKSAFGCDYPIDKSNWFQVFSACLGKMMVIQNACSDIVVRGRDWDVDFSEGYIYFDDDAYPIQFIGSESSSDDSWLWGWENVNGFDDNLLTIANQAKRLGDNWHLEPLTTAEIEITDTFNGHNLSIVACGVSKDNLCYYRGPHTGGAIFVAFSDVPAEVFSPIDASKFTTTVMQCIEQFHVEHEIFVESLLLWNHTKYEWIENKIIAHFIQDLSIEFEQADEFLRITSIKTI